jgi:hypothetical protein
VHEAAFTFQENSTPQKMNLVFANGDRHPNWGYHHVVLHVRSRLHNVAWFIDLTGAQYGSNQLVHRSDVYKALFVQDMKRYYQFGFCNGMFQKLAKVGGYPMLEYGLRFKAAHQLEKTLVSWEKQHLSMADLVGLDDLALFEQKKHGLYEGLLNALATYFGATNLAPAIKKWRRYDERTGRISVEAANSVMDDKGTQENLMTQQASSLEFW